MWACKLCQTILKGVEYVACHHVSIRACWLPVDSKFYFNSITLKFSEKDILKSLFKEMHAYINLTSSSPQKRPLCVMGHHVYSFDTLSWANNKIITICVRHHHQVDKIILCGEVLIKACYSHLRLIFSIFYSGYHGWFWFVAVMYLKSDRDHSNMILHLFLDLLIPPPHSYTFFG